MHEPGPEGAMIERGTIIDAENGKYIVASGTRDGVITAPLAPATGSATYSRGEWVYFFVFEDGQGLILGPTGR